VHLGEERPRRCALPVERLDPAQPPQYGPRFVHPATVATAFARVCVRTVSKGIRFIPAVAPNPDRELGEARAAIDRGDAPAALKRLDRARRGYGKRRDHEGLEHVLDMAALVETEDDRTRIGRENLEYAVKQNLRQESRRGAQERQQPWSDPYPDLQAASEHTGLVLTRPVKLAIGAGVLLGTAALLAIIILPWFIESDTGETVTLRLVNDTPAVVTLRGCGDPACDFPWLDRELDPGLETQTELASDDHVDLFKVEDACLPLRIHDAVQQLESGDSTLAVRLSEATPCPGTTVLPEPAGPTEL
jgi:hypothetical protein